MKTGLVMEGGAMRGMFTAGVTDVLMENGITFDGGIGVSAGATFGCNYKSKQIGRAFRYNKQYCRDPRYVGIRSLLTTGNLYNEQFAYHELPERLDVFDAHTFAENPMEFYVVCTDVQTGNPVYHRCEQGGAEDIEWMRASASMPMVSRIVRIGERLLLDGGVSDSIPLRYFEQIGYRKNVVILTQPNGFIKKKNSLLPVLRAALREYPALVQALAERHLRYNETLAYIETQRQNGNVLVIQPPESLQIGAVERRAEELERVYRIGRKEAQNRLEQVSEFLNDQK
ncbi:MAG: patatin family protein [Firmicutes bacterium]|nr:patatin family protein [Bacillota bacterium]